MGPGALIHSEAQENILIQERKKKCTESNLDYICLYTHIVVKCIFWYLFWRRETHEGTSAHRGHTEV